MSFATCSPWRGQRAELPVDARVNWVELVRRYSNRADLQERLAATYLRASHGVEDEPDSSDMTVSGRAPSAWRVNDRLTDNDIQKLLGEFMTGTSKQELATKYELSLSSVKRLLRQHGARRNDRN